MDTGDGRSVLVTGGRGFIGRATVKLLRRAGYKVASLDAKADATASADEDEIVCDLTEAKQVERVFQARSISGILHLAAILPTAAQREPERATQVNVEGSLHLLEMARRFGIARFVFGSSLSIYGTWPADRVVSETDRAAPEDLYGAAKLYVERLGEAYRISHGLEFVSLRIGRVVGAGAQSASSAWRSEIFEKLASTNAAEIAMPYAGPERILVVHVHDVARMLIALIQATCPEHAIYNAVCESLVVADLKTTVERLNPKVHVRLGEELATGNPRMLNSSRFQKEFSFGALPISRQLAESATKT
jgi:nucleoside-diphosphate-sugar epimerase